MDIDRLDAQPVVVKQQTTEQEELVVAKGPESIIVPPRQELVEADEQADSGDNENGREMSKSGGVCCLPKQAISNVYKCILSCITFTSLIYITLLVFCLASGTELDLAFLVIGYLSLFSLVTTPLGILGSSRASYCALFTFLLISSYHLYGLIMYFWFNLRAPIFQKQHPLDDSARFRGYELLHYITSGAYTSLVSLSLLLASCKIVSLVNQIEPARVIIVDNNPE